jgi:hypothetical protein|tara:strand:+ start:2344 stop:2475 length:132 start_codon:yes stop_codon:yes gene_type:complete
MRVANAIAEIIPAIERGMESTREGKAALLEFMTSKELAFSTFR